MTIEMIDKWVNSFRFNEIKNLKKCLVGFLIDFIFCRLVETSLGFSISHVTFPEVTSVWGVSSVAILDSSVNCVYVWSTKKLTMPAYIVAMNCNNSQTTPGITMHKLPRNRPAVRRKWIKFIQFKRADFLAGRITPICVASISVSAISQTLWNTTWGLLRNWQDVPVLFQNPAWQAQTDTAVSLWVSRAKYQFRLQSSSWPFCRDSPEWRSRSRDLGVMATVSVRQKMPFFSSCIYNPQITVSPTSSFSASFNRNRVKNHP